MESDFKVLRKSKIEAPGISRLSLTKASIEPSRPSGWRLAPRVRRDAPPTRGLRPGRFEPAVVELDIDRAEPCARGYYDLLGHSAAGQRDVDGEEVAGVFLLQPSD